MQRLSQNLSIVNTSTEEQDPFFLFPPKKATGCGKTHTISGTPEDPGVIFLTMKELYNRIECSREESDVKVRLSYLEIYNESIRDLLSPTPTPPGQGLMLREDAAKKISVVGITEHIPESPERVLEMIQEGNLRRTMSPTEANAVSSRSHAVLQINVTQRPRTADTVTETTSASLNIIDLAGSERASATRNNGVRMKEGANINKSLLALGNCINALCQSGGQRFKHVPYRNSKLTRLLKFSLGGNCKTVMIVCVSPSSAHYDETHNTLKYANQAKNIRTKVSRNMLNVDRHVAQYVQAIHELREEVAELKGKLAERTAWENALEKKKKAEMVKEIQEAKSKMKGSTEGVKRIVKEKAGVEAQLAMASVRLALYRQRMNLIDAEIQLQPQEAKDLEAEKDILMRMAEKEKCILQDENLLSTSRTLENSLQMQRGIIMAASQNTKFDLDAAEMIRVFGEGMLSEVESIRSNVKYEALLSTSRSNTDNIADLVRIATRSIFALKEASLQLQSSTQEKEATKSTSLLLSTQMHNVCNDNDNLFTRLIGPNQVDVLYGQSNALQRTMRKQVSSQDGPAPIRYPHQMPSRTSMTGMSTKALLPIKTPRKSKTITRRSSVGSRRSGVHINRASVGMTRSFSNNSNASAPKKSFRWADEAGEGRIDNYDRKSASPPQVKISIPLHKAEPAEDSISLQSVAGKWKTATLHREIEIEASPASATDWEDVSRAEVPLSTTVTSHSLRGKREGGSLFESNFLVKKEAKQSSKSLLEEEGGDSTFSDGIRTPFSELCNVPGEASSDDQSLLEYSTNNFRSSPYRPRKSHLGPVRRKARSSIGDSSIQSAKSTSSVRLATGPPLFTASRSSRLSTNDSSTRRISQGSNGNTSLAKSTTTLLSNNSFTHPSTNKGSSSSSGTAWR